MATDIDGLQIQINAQVTKASATINSLVKKIDRLSASLSTLDGHGLRSLASGVQSLGTAMQTMSNVKTTEFTRLAKNLTALNNINVAQLNNVSANVTKIGQSLSGLSGVSQGTQQIVELANGIKQLGYKSADKAITNIPQLATTMKQLMKELSTAPKVSQNLIDMTNALAKLARTGSSSGKAATSLSNVFDKIGVSSSNAVSGIKKINLSFSGLARKLLPFISLWKMFDFGKQAVEVSASLTEIQNVVDVTFGDFKQKIEDLASTSITDLGMSELTTKQIASRFQAMGTAMGFTKGQMSDMSVELTRLTGDMASFYDASQEDVGKALQSIFTGETEPMRKYGIDLTNATIQQWALNNGMSASVNNMTQMEKAMLRYQYVMANTGAAQGDFLRTQDSWSNQVRILKQQLQQLASIIGGDLVNAFKPLVTGLNNAMNHMIAFAETVSNALGKIFGWTYEKSGGGAGSDIASELGSSADYADDMASGIGDAASNASNLKKTLSTLNFDNLNQLSAASVSGGSGGSGSGTSGTGTGTATAGGAWKKTDGLVETFKSEINSLYGLGKYIGDTLSDTLSSIDWDKVYEKASGFGKGLADFMNGLISPNTFRNVATTIAGSLNTALHFLDAYGSTFDWNDFGNSIAAGVNEFFEKFDFGLLAHTLKTWAHGILDSMITAIKKTDWEEIGEKIGDFLSEIDFLEIAKKMAKLFWEAINAAISSFASMFSKAPIETAFLTAVTLPKLLNKISGTKIVTGLRNLVNGAEDLGKKLLGLEEAAEEASGSMDGLGGSTKETNTVMGRLKTTVTDTQKKMKLFTKLSIGSAGLLTDLSLTQSAFYNLTMDSEAFGVSLGKIASGAGVAFGSLKLIGLSNPFSAILTGAMSFLGAINGLNTALGEKAEIERYGDTLENITTNLNESLRELEVRHEASVSFVEDAGLAETLMLESLADRYFELAEKENLSVGEKKEMQRISEQLVGYLPQLENYFNTETGLITAQKDAVKDLIDQRLNDIKVQAAEEALLELYQQQIDATKELRKQEEYAATATEEWVKRNNEVTRLEDLYGVFKKYQEITQQIKEAGDSTGELKKKQEEYIRILENSDVNIDWYAEDGGILNYLDDAEREVRDFEKEYYTAMDNMSQAEIGLLGINTSIEEMEKTVRAGMYKAGEGASEGFAEGIKSNDYPVEAALNEAASLHKIGDEIKEGSKQVGEDTGTNFAEGIESKSSWVAKLVSGVSNVATDALKSTNGAYAAGEEVGNAYGEGLASSGNRLTQIASGLMDRVRSSLMGKIGNVLNFGGNISVSGIPKYAVGGFPEDGVFYANHTELVGKFSNGKTVVANNGQITKGIADAVYPAVYNAIMEAMTSTSASGGTPEYIVNNISIDGESIARAVTRGQKSLDRRFNPSPQFG